MRKKTTVIVGIILLVVIACSTYAFFNSGKVIISVDERRENYIKVVVNDANTVIRKDETLTQITIKDDELLWLKYSLEKGSVQVTIENNSYSTDPFEFSGTSSYFWKLKPGVYKVKFTYNTNLIESILGRGVVGNIELMAVK